MVQIIKFGVKINYFVSLGSSRAGPVVRWAQLVISTIPAASRLNIIKLSSRPIYDKIATAGRGLFYWSELTRTESTTSSLIDIWMHFSCPLSASPCYILMVFTGEHKYRSTTGTTSTSGTSGNIVPSVHTDWQHTCIPVLQMSHGQGSALETFSHTNTQSENLHKSISPIFCWKQQPRLQSSQLSWQTFISPSSRNIVVSPLSLSHKRSN